MRLTLASFNLENLDDTPDDPLARRLDALRRLLIEAAADVLCLQEVNAQRASKRGRRRFAALDALVAGTAYAVYARASDEGPDGPRDVHNLVVLSRFPIAAVERVHHHLVKPPLYRAVTARPGADVAPVGWDRPLLHVTLAVGGARLHVINLHLRAPLATAIPGQKIAPFVWRSVAGWAEGSYLAALKRAGQALEARLLMDRLLEAGRGALIAVAGDFNAEANEIPLRLLTGEPEETGNPALADRRLVNLTAMLPAQRRFSVLHGGRRRLVDHVLGSVPLYERYRGGAILNRGLEDEVVVTAGGGRAAASFHAPVIAKFSLQD